MFFHFRSCIRICILFVEIVAIWRVSAAPEFISPLVTMVKSLNITIPPMQGRDLTSYPEALPFDLHHFANTSRGISALTSFVPRALLAAIPQTSVLHSVQLCRSACGRTVAERCISVPHCNVHVASLIACLIQERALGNMSHWVDFISLLPRSFSSHLVAFDQCTRAAPYFSRWSLTAQWLEEQKTQRLYVDLLQTVSSEVFSSTLIIWAWRAVSSRSFGVPIDMMFDSPLLTNHTDICSREGAMVMVPLADQFNHASNPSVELVLPMYTEPFELRLLDVPVELLAELSLRYFDPSATPVLAILSNYGFVDETGPATLRLQTAWSGRYQETMQRYDHYLEIHADDLTDAGLTGASFRSALESLLDNLQCTSPTDVVRYTKSTSRLHMLSDTSTEATILPIGYLTCDYLFSLPASHLHTHLSGALNINVDTVRVSRPKQRLLLRAYEHALKGLLDSNCIPSTALHLQLVRDWQHVLRTPSEYQSLVDRVMFTRLANDSYENTYVSASIFPRMLHLVRIESSVRYASLNPVNQDLIKEARFRAALEMESLRLYSVLVHDTAVDSIEEPFTVVQGWVDLDRAELVDFPDRTANLSFFGLHRRTQWLNLLIRSHTMRLKLAVLECDWYIEAVEFELVLLQREYCGHVLNQSCFQQFPQIDISFIDNLHSILLLHQQHERVLRAQIKAAVMRLDHTPRDNGTDDQDDNVPVDVLPELQFTLQPEIDRIAHYLWRIPLSLSQQ